MFSVLLILVKNSVITLIFFTCPKSVYVLELANPKVKKEPN